jgi:hypothetical protein
MVAAKTGEYYPSRNVVWERGRDRIEAGELPSVKYAQVRFFRPEVSNADASAPGRAANAAKDL